MQELILVPDPLASGNETLARYATQTRFEHGWRSEVAMRLDAAPLAAAAPAEVARNSLTMIGRPDTSACLAAPVHVHVGRYGGRLAEPGVLAFQPEVAAKLGGEFRAAFDPADCELHALADGTFLALVRRLEAVTTFDPQECLDEPVDAYLPSGPGARRLRQLSTEIEMWLHGLEENRARAAAGLPAITGLWLWGCGEALANIPVFANPARSLAVYSRDPFLLGMGRLLKAAVSEHHAISMDSILSAKTDRAAATAGNALIVAAIDLVRSGAVARLHVVMRDRVLSLRRRDFLKFWRRSARVAGRS